MANRVLHPHDLRTRVTWEQPRLDDCPIDWDSPLWSTLGEYVEQKWQDIAPVWPSFHFATLIHIGGSITVKALENNTYRLLAELDYPPPNVDPLSPVWE